METDRRARWETDCYDVNWIDGHVVFCERGDVPSSSAKRIIVTGCLISVAAEYRQYRLSLTVEDKVSEHSTNICLITVQ